MNILIALDKFKHSFTASEGCEIAKQALSSVLPEASFDTAPLTDGGEGFVETLVGATQGQLHHTKATGPYHRIEREVSWGLTSLHHLDKDFKKHHKLPDNGTIAIVEMAQATGLQLVPREERNPWMVSSYGTGEMLAAAAGHMPEVILLGIGGSATNDMGVGCLDALGLELYDNDHNQIRKINPHQWSKVSFLSGNMMPMPRILIACDVNNPLTGSQGATAIYGPQKGLKPQDRKKLETAVIEMAKRLCIFYQKPEELMQEPGMGAAGGIAFGLKLAYNATLISGFDIVSECLKINDKINNADIIITGEGRVDLSSFQGKGPGSLIQKAIQRNKKLIIIAGQIDDDAITWLKKNANNASAYLLAPDGYTMQQSVSEGKELLASRMKEAASQLNKN